MPAGVMGMQGPHIFLRRKKSLGQCFLSSREYLDAEAEMIAPSQKIVAEIGGGDGRLSERIVLHGAKKLFIIEKDERYTRLLREKFSSYNVEVINSDFLDVPPLKADIVCGNIPYNISSQITFRLLEWKFKRAVLMYQKEFCEKMLASGNGKSRLSFFCQYYFDMEPLLFVPRTAFRPIPKVDSMLLELVPKKARPLGSEVSESITMLFQHRPKMLATSLKIILKHAGRKYYPLEDFARYGLSKRIFELSNDEILEVGTKLAGLLQDTKQLEKQNQKK
ncbi:MAG: 16S rRNA (adenine(1518)-N(6)/adenine(1519)-N(6))-dimethyltransferase RsmA [Candidatus Micrarchaeota archaeon]|nr:16S rRNA (adenine(1518)-N(6)/adenine(1519)-N(6))-dimethyltransferase RsmA [Candidatus Micrarchaeota archaeon]